MPPPPSPEPAPPYAAPCAKVRFSIVTASRAAIALSGNAVAIDARVPSSTPTKRSRY